MDALLLHHARPLRHASGIPPSRVPQGFCIESQSALSGQCIAGPHAPFAWGWRHFSCVTLPRPDTANNGLPTTFYVDPLDNNGLLAAVSVFPKCLHLGSVGAG